MRSCRTVSRFYLVLSLEECENWSCDDVSRWLRSKGQPYGNYADLFKNQSIDGNHLVGTVNERDLFRYPRARKGDQQKVCEAIKLLKEAITMKFYRQFHNDDFALPITIFGTSEKIKSCTIRPDINCKHKHAYEQIVSWIGELPEATAIEKIELISPNDHFRAFLKRISAADLQDKQREFISQLENKESLRERHAVLDRLRTLTKQVKHRQSVSIARLWYRCDAHRLKNVMFNGFSQQDMQANGWFGQGIYLSSSAKDAPYYKKPLGCIIMCYAIILNPYPIISDDASISEGNLKLRFYSSKNYLNYHCHYIPVLPTKVDRGSSDLPPKTGTQDALYDQVVMFSPDDILPQCVIYLKPKTKVLSTIPRRKR